MSGYSNSSNGSNNGNSNSNSNNRNSSSASGGGGGGPDRYPRSNAPSSFSLTPIGQPGVNVLSPLYVPTSGSNSGGGGPSVSNNEDNLQLVTYNRGASLDNLSTSILIANIQVINHQIVKKQKELDAVSTNQNIGDVDIRNQEQIELKRLAETKTALEREFNQRQEDAKKRRDSLMAAHRSNQQMLESMRTDDIGRLTRELQETFVYFKWIALREHWTVEEYEAACQAAITGFTLYQNYIYGSAYVQQELANIMSKIKNIRESTIEAIRTAGTVVSDPRFAAPAVLAGTIGLLTRPLGPGGPNFPTVMGTGGIPYLVNVLRRYGLTRLANMSTRFLQNNLYVVLVVVLGNVLSFLYTIESNETGYTISRRDYSAISNFIEQVRENYTALRQRQSETGSDAAVQFTQSQLNQISGLLNQIVERFPQVASVLSPEAMSAINSIQITRPNIMGVATSLTHGIIRGVTRAAELVGDLYGTVRDFFYDTGFDPKNPEHMAKLAKIIDEQMKARDTALKQTEQNEAARAAEYAKTLEDLTLILTGMIKTNPNSFTSSGSTNVSAASSAAQSLVESVASSRASVIAGSLGVELSKLSDTRPTLSQETVTALLSESAELVGYIPLPTEEPETGSAVGYIPLPTEEPDAGSASRDASEGLSEGSSRDASQGSQYTVSSLGNSVTEEMDVVDEEQVPLLELDPRELTNLVNSFNPINGSVSGPITVTDTAEQPVTATVNVTVSQPLGVIGEINAPESPLTQTLMAVPAARERVDEYLYGPSSKDNSQDSDDDLDGGRRKSKRRRNKRQTKKKRPIRRRQRRQTKRRQRRYTKRRVLRKRR